MTEAKMTMQHALAELLNGVHLSRGEAFEVMELIMQGEATPAQIAAILIALRTKGETVEEISGFAASMRNNANQVQTLQEGLLDTCGTGGSGIHKLNVSTTAAIIASAAGIRVAKHGNRASSGKSGSADVLEALGVNITLNAEQAAACLDEVGICFMFAQLYHPSMRYAGPVRREIGVRTVFNMLGPLSNPAGADRQVIGVYDRTKTALIAEVLRELGLVRALVVGAEDGLDEISLSSSTIASELRDGVVTTFEITPEQLGLQRVALADVLGGTPLDNAAAIRDILDGKRRDAYRDIVLANAGACIYIGGQASTLIDGVRMAGQVIDDGRAAAKLAALVSKTREFE